MTKIKSQIRTWWMPSSQVPVLDLQRNADARTVMVFTIWVLTSICMNRRLNNKRRDSRGKWSKLRKKFLFRVKLRNCINQILQYRTIYEPTSSSEEESNSPRQAQAAKKVPVPDEPVQQFEVEMLANIQIDNNYILTSHMGEWQKIYMEYKFTENQLNLDLKGELPRVHQ